MLRWVLPLCLLAAAAVAGQGLFRVVGQPTAQPVASGAPSLDLGVGSGATASSPPSPAPAPSRIVASSRSESRPERVTKPVVVMNASGVTGLAGRAATLLRQRGVRVAAIGNVSAARRPEIPATPTVYYPPGEQKQALALARLTDAHALAPAPQWLGADGRLVLVVTSATRELMKISR